MKDGVSFVYSPQLLAYAQPGGVVNKTILQNPSGLSIITLVNYGLFGR